MRHCDNNKSEFGIYPTYPAILHIFQRVAGVVWPGCDGKENRTYIRRNRKMDFEKTILERQSDMIYWQPNRRYGQPHSIRVVNCERRNLIAPLGVCYSIWSKDERKRLHSC